MANLLQKIGATLMNWGSGQPAQAKASPYQWPIWLAGMPQWSKGNFSSYVANGYELNAVINAALMYKFRAISSAPLRAWRVNADNRTPLPQTDPLAKVLHRPNPYQSNAELWGNVTLSLNLAGNAYIYVERDRRGEASRLWCLRPDRVYIIPGGDGILGYKYTPIATGINDGIAIIPEDIIHIKLPNPGDDLEGLGYGLSPIAAMSQSGDVDNEITKFLQSLFQNRTILGGYLRFKTSMKPSDVEAVSRRWEEKYGGVENWGKVATLDNEGEFVPLSPDFQKLSFANLDQRNVARILAVFGVPGMLLGLQMEHSTFSNYEQAYAGFWQDTLVPELTLIETEADMILGNDQRSIAFDTSKVRALQQDVPKLADAALKMWSAGIPRNVAFAAVGLKLPPTPGDDVSYLPVGVLPADLIGKPQPPAKAAPPLSQKAEPTPPRRLKWSSEAEQKALYKALDALATTREISYEDGAAQAFEADKRAVLALLTQAKATAVQRKATVNWTDYETNVKDYLESEGADNWRTTFVPLFEATVTDIGNFWATKLGLAFDVRNLLGEAWFNDYTLQFAQPINQTSSDTLHDVIAQAQAEGWSIQKMQNNLTTLFDQWAKGDVSDDDLAWLKARAVPFRAEMIARTETTRLQSAGAQALFTDWEIASRTWLSTNDKRTRPSHLKANMQSKPISEAFDIGGYQMMYPGDMSKGAPLAEAVSCRCTLLPDVEA